MFKCCVCVCTHKFIDNSGVLVVLVIARLFGSKEDDGDKMTGKYISLNFSLFHFLWVLNIVYKWRPWEQIDAIYLTLCVFSAVYRDICTIICNINILSENLL